MAVNPIELMKMGQKLKQFQQQHPKFPAFLRQVKEQALVPGAIVEIKVTSPEGQEYITNLRLTEEDVEMVRTAASIKH